MATVRSHAPYPGSPPTCLEGLRLKAAYRSGEPKGPAATPLVMSNSVPS